MATHRISRPDAQVRDVVAARSERPQLAVGRSVVVTIGIDTYKYWRGLECAVNDARGARDAFTALGFEDATPPLYNEAATRDALIAIVTDGLHALSEHDKLVVFYAGHGGTRTERPGGKETRTGYLVPVDAARDDDNVASWIDLGDWLRRVALLPPRHILVILDSCHSGIALHPAYRWRGLGSRARASLKTLQARTSRRVITSALDDQLALDSGPRSGHSLFTGCLIDALEEARDAGRVLTGSALGLRLQTLVSSFPNSRQTPDFGEFERDERGEMVISASEGTAGEVEISWPDWPGTAPLPTVPAQRLLESRPPWRLLRHRWWWIAGVVFWILFLIGSALW